MKQKVDIRFSISFPLTPLPNGICFTKESLEGIEDNLENIPIIQGNNVIGIIKPPFSKIQLDKSTSVSVDGILFLECNPEMKVKLNDAGVIQSFEIVGVNIGG